MFKATVASWLKSQDIGRIFKKLLMTTKYNVNSAINYVGTFMVPFYCKRSQSLKPEMGSI